MAHNEDEERIDTHPSYGMAGFYRSQGGHFSLFGSSLKHNNTIHLTVKRGYRRRNLNTDWYYGREELIEIRFSPVQFAELLTTMNCGDGVPCTLEYVSGQRMPDCPEECNKSTEAHDEFNDQMRSIAKRLEGLVEAVDELLANPKPNKADREAIRANVYKLRQQIASNLPFMVKCFTEAAEEIVGQAKGEIDAAFTGAIHRLGMKALHEAIGSERLTVPALEGPDA